MKIKKSKQKIAYFSLEVALDNGLKNYAGGLGILAGDLLKAAADLGVPFCGLTLLNDQGYFKQKLEKDGRQEAQVEINFDFSKLEKLPNIVKVKIETEDVSVGVWRYIIKGLAGHEVPLYLLDTNLAVNSPVNQKITQQLYRGDSLNRLKQEIILGRGGVKMLASLGEEIKKFHLNEGHSCFVPLELFLNSTVSNHRQKLKDIRDKCVFTIHTSVPAAQNIYSFAWLLKIQPELDNKQFNFLSELIVNGQLDFKRLGFYFSGFVNGVSKSHQAVLKKIFPQKKINYITNGVHAGTWTAKSLAILYNEYLPDWESNNERLKKIKQIPLKELWLAHQEAKQNLLEFVKNKIGEELPLNKLTIVWARRVTQYKQVEFLFQNINELKKLNTNQQGLQIILAGKAHPADLESQDKIIKIYQIKEELAGTVEVVFLENYDLEMAKLLVSGADLWLNTPLIPNEASGTSGMKAALNGVPQISTLDGWWPEGYLKNKTGWAIHNPDDLYKILKTEVFPLYYEQPQKWLALMKTVISNNAVRFSAARAIKEYQRKAY